METTKEELINDKDYENEKDDSEPDDDNDNQEWWNKESNSSVDEGIQFNEDYDILISKVCKMVKLFGKSPL